MKAITIKQPWATLIVKGYKKYEFRTWKTKYRGKILIHAGKGVDKKCLEKFKHLNLEYPAGCIIGEVEITDCIELNEETENKIIEENPLVYGHHKRREGYAWKLTNPKEIEKIEMNGQLGLWNYEKKED